MRKRGETMALTQVRAKIGEEWLTLTLNEATGRYEAQTTAQGTSVHQPGGYWPGEVEATDEAGETVAVTADNMSSLRFVVREESAPALTLISPAPGYLLAQENTFVFEAVDEAGGSGVDPDSFSLEGAAAEEIPGGYRFTWSTAWADGQHTIMASVSDYDGNAATVSGAYIVDTVPPELYLQEPYQRHVTDEESVLVAGAVSDPTSGVGAVIVAGEAVSVASGRFETTVPLEVGENTIPIMVTDRAGNSTAGSVYMIRLITDRTQADADALAALAGKSWSKMTQEEKDLWNGLAKGGYNAQDYNRVGVAVGFLAEALKKRGYRIPVDAKTDWEESDAPTVSNLGTYLSNVARIRAAQPIDAPPVPPDWVNPTIQKANDIEKILVETDALFPKYFAWTAGEITAGGY